VFRRHKSIGKYENRPVQISCCITVNESIKLFSDELLSSVLIIIKIQIGIINLGLEVQKIIKQESVSMKKSCGMAKYVKFSTYQVLF
jgi:hypothetical protein